jgi:hypothetical protein
VVDLAADSFPGEEYWGAKGALARALEFEFRAVDLTNDSSSGNEDTDATVKDANAPECEFLFIIDLLASESTD